MGRRAWPAKTPAPAAAFRQVASYILRMPVEPPTTFADLERQHLEVEVTCQKCGHRAVVDGGAKAIAGRRIAGARFRCSQPGCGGIGLPSIGKQRRWTRRLAEHARTRGR
jgi:hypothetical protein